MRRWLASLLISLLLLGATGMILHWTVNQQEKVATTVTLSQQSNNKTWFFYRDDCPDCQTIYHQVYWHNFIHHDVVFINLNNQANRQYIQSQGLTAVPTFINGEARYTGTNREQIDSILAQSN